MTAVGLAWCHDSQRRHLALVRGKSSIAVSFINAEKEDLIFDDRPPEGAAELIERQARLPVQKSRPGIQLFRVESMKQAAVYVVCAGLADDVNVAAQSVGVFRRERSFRDVHLLNSFKADDLDVVEPSPQPGLRRGRVAARLDSIQRELRATPAEAVHHKTSGRVARTSGSLNGRSERKQV